MNVFAVNLPATDESDPGATHDPGVESSPAAAKFESGPSAQHSRQPGRRLFDGLSGISSRLSTRPEAGVVIALAVLILIIGGTHHRFLAFAQLIDIVRGATYVGIIACGMVFLIAMRELDLSVGAIFGAAIIVASLLMNNGINPWLAASCGIAIGALLGALNGAVCHVIGISSIIVTLGTLSVFRGLAIALCEGAQVGGLPMQHAFFTIVGGSLLGVPTSVWVLLLTGGLMTAVLTRTRFGLRVRTIGSNPEAAIHSGISVTHTRWMAFTLAGALAALSGMLTLAFFGMGEPMLGRGYELTAIAAAVIGGTPLRGGSGSILGAIVGCILLATVDSGLVFFGVPINWSLFATGSAILAAVALDALVRSRRLTNWRARA